MLNQITVIGNCGDKTFGGENHFSFSVATNEKWKDKNGEEKKATQWHKVVAFGKLAEICSQYIDKGRQVCVQGKMQYSKYKDNSGVERDQAQIIADKVFFLGVREQTRTSDSHDFGSDSGIPF